MIKRTFFFLFIITSPFNLYSQLYFNEVSDFQKFNHTYFNVISGAGVSFVDFNQDGFDDISIPTNDDNSILFFKNSNDKFDLVNFNIDFPYQVKQILWIDYDNDGDKDIYVTSYNGKNKLFQNHDFLYFDDVTVSVGLPDSISNSFGASWSDINNDGYLDLYQTYRSIDSLSYCGNLYLSDSAKFFNDITYSSGISEFDKAVFCATFLDIDNDNFQDLYIANDKFTVNSMYRNNGDNTFADISSSSNTGIPMNAMSVTIGDFNNDGYFDIYSTNIDTSKLFVNNMDLTFTERAEQAGVSFNGGVGWGAQFSDFDLDGYEDLYVSGSLVGTDPISSAYYSNIFGKYFTLNTSVGLEADTVLSFGNAIGDFNNDGYPDMVVLNSSPYNSFLFENNYSGSNNWIKINLRGIDSNYDSYGSIIKLYSYQLNQTRSTHSTQGYISQNTNSIFFGIGDNVKIDSLIIEWSSGIVDKIIDPQINSTLNIFEGSSLTPPRIFSRSLSFCEGGSILLEAGEFSSYKWSTNETTKIISVFEEGYYYVEVTDRDGNTFLSDSILVTKKTLPQFSLITKNITANHSSSISITGLDENDSYFISLDGSSYLKNNFYFTNLTSGNHQVKVRDSFGCEVVKEFTILNLVKDSSNPEEYNKSIARKWMEILLEAIRNDLARPPIHARNLFHISAMMYDAFVINNKVLNSISSSPYLLNKTIDDIHYNFEYPQKFSLDEDALNKIISFSAYNFLIHRFKNSIKAAVTLHRIDSMMINLDYDFNFSGLDYLSGDPRSIGNYLSKLYIEYGYNDNSNEINNYVNNYYKPINPPLNPELPGNPDLIDPNRWQSLFLEEFIDQSGNLIQGVPDFISPEWGNVLPFALLQEDMVVKVRDDDIYKVYHDVGDPPYLDTVNQGQLDSIFKKAFSMVSVWSSHLDRKDGVTWDISPKSIGNVIDYPNSIAEYSSFYNYFGGGDSGNGYELNPITGVPYEEQLVPRGDYTRVLAEFWADGPDSETPPGHWFVILNQVNDSEFLEKKFEGEGDILDDLEWDIKSYFTLGGAMHDAAITAWGIKGYYDYIRPISVIRYLSDQGQSTYVDSLNYNINGINLIDNYINLVYVDDPLVGDNLENLGKIKLFTWNGHTSQGSLDESGSGWILAENWWPYQRPTFVTPPFAGYVSGHSTYSKAAAEVLSKISGSPFFPGGMGEFHINKNEFLVFEEGPSIDMILQWAKYEDAADQCSLSRIWGGIHPYIDDIPGRMIGKEIGNNAFNLAKTYFQRDDIINEIENYPNDYVIYPNPTRNNSFINLINESSKEISYIEMYDLNGIKQNISIIDGLQRNYRINISNVSSGIYIIYLIFSDGSNKSTKLVIRK